MVCSAQARLSICEQFGVPRQIPLDEPARREHAAIAHDVVSHGTVREEARHTRATVLWPHHGVVEINAAGDPSSCLRKGIVRFANQSLNVTIAAVHSEAVLLRLVHNAESVSRCLGFTRVSRHGHSLTPELSLRSGYPREVYKSLRHAIVAGAGIAMILTLASCSAPPPPEPEVLTASQAGGAYLDAVCPVNAAWDQADAELERLRIAALRGPANESGVTDALAKVASASSRAAAQLDPKETTWPKPARAAVADVRRTLLDDREQALKLVKFDATALVDYSWKGGDETAAAAAAARTALALPSDPDVACAQWAALRAEDAATEEGKELATVTPDVDEKPTPAPTKSKD
ncbi:hypothetical protein EDF62_1078 [Leucobacter luti]|uniref:Uncharacterized protein n=1 Tax=Leucobacter luti TaxID=340320 RepID=A0A4R6S648_9MICO|nr:hypothetical protein EDF62_1078 [Leucobacter luti]